jgi:hypothetical protein
MKFFIYIVIFTISISGLLAQLPKPISATLKRGALNTPNIAVTGRYLYTYDENNFLVEALYQYYDLGTWNDDLKYTYINNSDGSPIEAIYSISIFGQYWKVEQKTEYVYDSAKNLIYTENSLFFPASNSFVPTIRESVIYDSTGTLLLQKILESYNQTDDVWYLYSDSKWMYNSMNRLVSFEIKDPNKHEKDTLMYGSNNRLKTKIHYEDYDSGLELDFKEEFTYENANSENYTKYRYFISSITGDFFLASRENHEFLDGLHTIFTEGFNHTNMVWRPSRLHTILSDSNFLLLDKELEWADSTNSWFLMKEYSAALNPNGTLDSTMHVMYDEDEEQYFIPWITKYEYAPSNTQTPVLDATVRTFPNPTTDYLNVTIKSENKKQPISITLTDAQGRTVYQQPVALIQSSISMQQQAAGLYFLRVEQGGAVKTVPVMKQ